MKKIINNAKSLIAGVSVVVLTSVNLYSQSMTLEVDQIIVQNIQAPWGMAFINNNEILFTEKSGKLRKHTISSKTTVDITGVPSVSNNGQGGLLDVVLHPNFETNNFVYLSYAINVGNGQTTAIGRGMLQNNTLQNFKELFRGDPAVNSGSHFGSRIVFDRQNFLYFSIGDRGTQENAQNLDNHAGKVMRLKDDGTVPTDNPFVNQRSAKPEIYCYGNRNIQGMAMNPTNGLIYASEHGPRGGDELNLIKKGANYGWPVITFGENYNGTAISKDTARDGMEQPLTYWIPSIAPCGMAFIKNNQPAGEVDILFGALAGTHIHWLKMKNDKVIASSKSLQGYARFRDVRQAPDGSVYALTESPNRIVKLKSTGLITNIAAGVAANNSILIYPNPGNHHFYIDNNNLSISKVRILDNIGILRFERSNANKAIVETTLDIDASNFTSGIYQVEIEYKNGNKEVVKWSK